jgi:restriction endonuclease-like protein
MTESYGSSPVVVYEPYQDGVRHGNFLDESYASILQNQEWQKRLLKAHAQAKRSLPRRDRKWMELDSSMSSDALLMNIFCYPGVVSLVHGMLGVERDAAPIFGFKACVPLANGRVDRTEVDMKLGSLLVESKLTESDFQARETAIVEGYRDFKEVFEWEQLDRTGECYRSYQLIRNVLAAHALEASFCVFLDARRPDLREDWYRLMLHIKDAGLRTRCMVLTWQELATALPPVLREFLDTKYGIVPPGCDPSPVPGTWQEAG